MSTLSATPITPDTGISARHVCAHCRQLGTTREGALWRASLHAACADLYYIHAVCVDRFKAAHGLRSVEGRLPRACAPTKGGRA